MRCWSLSCANVIECKVGENEIAQYHLHRHWSAPSTKIAHVSSGSEYLAAPCWSFPLLAHTFFPLVLPIDRDLRYLGECGLSISNELHLSIHGNRGTWHSEERIKYKEWIRMLLGASSQWLQWRKSRWETWKQEPQMEDPRLVWVLRELLGWEVEDRLYLLLPDGNKCIPWHHCILQTLLTGHSLVKDFETSKRSKEVRRICRHHWHST